jgi:hypothetical protein
VADLGELSARITAEVAAFERSMDDASASMDDFGKTSRGAGRDASQGMGQAERAAKNLTRAKVAMAAAAAAAVAALVQMTREGLAAADEHAKLARALGLSNEELAVMKRAADLSGLSVQQLETSTRQLNRALVDAEDGTGRAADAFEKLGVDAQALRDMDMESQMIALGEAFGTIDDRATRASVAQDLFGRSGMHMLNLMEDARGTFDRASSEVERFGLVLDDIDYANIELANDNIGALRAASSGLAQMMAATLAPSIINVTNRLMGMAEASIQSQRQFRDYMRWAQGLTNEMEDGEDRIASLTRARQQAQENANNASLRGFEGRAQGYRDEIAAIDRQIQAEENRASAQRDADAMLARFGARSEAVQKQQADEALAAAEAEARAAEVAAERQRMLRDAYSQTTEGMIQATEASIAHFKTYTPQGPMATAIIEMLTERLAALRGETDELTEATQRLTEGELESLQESLMTEEELLQRRFNTRLTMLQQAVEDEMMTEEQRRDAEMRLEQQHMDNMERVRRQGLSRIQQFTEMSWHAQTSQALGELAGLTRGLDRENRIQFNIMKAGAVATALINMYQGISQSLASYPMPLAGIMAAAHGAAGLATLNNIRNQSYGSGGGGNVPAAVTAPPTEAAADTGGGDSSISRSLLVQGDFDTGQLFTGEAVRQLMDSIAEAQRDGYQVVVV